MIYLEPIFLWKLLRCSQIFLERSNYRWDKFLIWWKNGICKKAPILHFLIVFRWMKQDFLSSRNIFILLLFAISNSCRLCFTRIDIWFSRLPAMTKRRIEIGGETLVYGWRDRNIQRTCISRVNLDRPCCSLKVGLRFMRLICWWDSYKIVIGHVTL